MVSDYGIKDISTLSFKDAVRTKVAMYLGSADMQGVYNAIQEIISNSIDEFYMGFGKEINITLNENKISVEDFGRGIPFGIKENGTNVLVDIFSKPHTGGKFNNKVYNSVAGLNGIGAKATCLSSKDFIVTSYRDNKMATAVFNKGVLEQYKEDKCDGKEGTFISFELDEEVYNVEPIKVDFKVICNKCRTLSYLTKGLTFNLFDIKSNTKITYCAKNGILDLIKDNSRNLVNSKPLYFQTKEDDLEVEVAFQWTKEKEKSYVFTNGLENIEGGTSLTGVKTALTNFWKKRIKGDNISEMARTGLIYAVSCKIPNPSFANQTKTKINNVELRGLSQRATTKALEEFEKRSQTDFKKVLDFLEKEKKAEQAAENARKKVLNATKEIEKNQKQKVFASDKLKNAEFLGQQSTLLLVEGDSASASMAAARDYKRYGILALRGM